VLGKGIVLGKDTPNFVGNRIGAHAMMVDHPPDADRRASPRRTSTTSRARRWATPRARASAPRISSASTPSRTSRRTASLAHHDEERDVFRLPAYVRAMVEKKILGDKTKGGFYKKARADADARPETLDVPREGRRRGIAKATKEHPLEDRGSRRRA
jgi:3-hydroxyacyl-CoA dehydrogenase